MDLARQEDLSPPDTGEASHVAALIDAECHLLHLLFTIPEQLDRERTAADHFGSPTRRSLRAFDG